MKQHKFLIYACGVTPQCRLHFIIWTTGLGTCEPWIGEILSMGYGGCLYFPDLLHSPILFCLICSVPSLNFFSFPLLPGKSLTQTAPPPMPILSQSEAKNPRINQLSARWQQVWLLALERQRKLNDALDRLEEVMISGGASG